MNKRKNLIIKIVVLILVLFILFKKKIFILALENNLQIKKCQLVFNQLQHSPNNNLTLTVVLNDPVNISLVDLKIYYDKSYLKIDEPLIDKNSLPINSMFDESEYIIKEVKELPNSNQNLINIVSLNRGFDEVTKSGNILIKFSFKIIKEINNIYTFFTFDDNSIKQNSINIQILDLSMNKYKIIYECLEEIKIEFDNSIKAVLVESEINKFIDELKAEIKILNRIENEYKMEFSHENINLNEIKHQNVKIVITDYKTMLVYYLSKIINVYDYVIPTIGNVPNEFVINSSDLRVDMITNNLINKVIINDNFDNNPQLMINYYNENNDLLKSLELLVESLKKVPEAYITFWGVDFTGNNSETYQTKIIVIDNEPPSIIFQEIIEVKDIDFSDFSLESEIKVIDNYDENPKLIVKLSEDNFQNDIDYKVVLQDNQMVKIKLSAFDEQMNTTDDYMITIKLIDTIPPTIIGVSDLVIDDKAIDQYQKDLSLLTKEIIINDNFTKRCEIRTFYYINEEEVTNITFFSDLKKGKTGIIKYLAFDDANNCSLPIIQTITIVDKTSPSILINNIDMNKKYTSIDLIDIQVNDNIDQEVTYVCYLNNEIWTNSSITKFGNYELVVKATDKSGNVTTKQINFSIIEDNILSCKDDVECYFRNYRDVLIITGVIVILIIIIIIVQVLPKKVKDQRKKNLNPTNDEGLIEEHIII